MKNSILYIFLIFLNLNLAAQEMEINANKIQYDDINKITIFEGNVSSKDENGNRIFSEYAKYNKVDEVIETVGRTKIITSKGYKILSSNIILDNKRKIILSDYKTEIEDTDGNKISVEMFNYSTFTNILFSKGNIEVFDINNNSYFFSEIYVDENKKKIIGSDVKAMLNQKSILVNKNNEPRIYANTMSLNENINTLEKGIFTYCKNRGEDKCPPWTLTSKKIRHDLIKKTIFYDDVVLKIYDFPIFYSPKFSHPDPTVSRRSGLLAPSLTSSTTVGSGFSLPYFWDIGVDRDLTVTPKLYLNENPLFLTEYRQDFKDSKITIDTGYTKGYKQTNNKKSPGGRAHFFANFKKNFINEDKKKSNIDINLQKTSNDTYFKVHNVDTTLVDKDLSILKNSIDFSYQNKDLYFGLAPSIYEDMNKIGHSRHEYFLPLNIEKNLMYSERLGLLDLETNVEIRNYEVNKQTNFLINNFNWRSNKWLNKLGFENRFESIVKVVNYEAQNTSVYKNDNTNSEINSALGYFAKLGLYKNDNSSGNFDTLTPRLLLRYAPGHMRNVSKGSGRLNYSNLYNLNKINEFDVVENGLSASIGFDYKKNKMDKKNNTENEIFSFSAGQVISAEENMDIPSSSSLDQRFSDIVGASKYNVNDKVKLNYNFSVDQSYKEFNYHDIEAEFSFTDTKFNIGYLEERNHIGKQEYIKSGIDYKINNATQLSFTTKRNLLTSSSEFYNLSYNYLNDCLTAGIAYRREFYTDRDLEPENRLMFTISLVPFAKIGSPNIK